MTDGPSRLIVFATGNQDQGPILLAEGCFTEEVAVAGSDISDHELPRPDGPGLWVFEGWVNIGPGTDPDVFLDGEWRRLTHWEMCRMRHGMAPWDEQSSEPEPVEPDGGP